MARVCDDVRVIDRLSAADSSFLYLEDASTATHVGQVLIFAAPDNFRPERVLEGIAARLSSHPRYRQKIRTLPGRIMTPVWIDDADFDLDYHVRRSALPAPGSIEQLQDFVARVASRPLDRSRPLWEVYVVEGLSEDRFAVVTKIHQALIDAGDVTGLSADPAARTAESGSWTPVPAPSTKELLGNAISGFVRRPTTVVEGIRGGVQELKATAGQVAKVGGTIARAAVAPPSQRAFAVEGHNARRYLMTDLDLADLREIRDSASAPDGTRPTVHAIALTVIAGALRGWLQARGEHISSARSVRALVPASVADDSTPYGSRVQAVFVELPVGEASPMMRLAQIQFSLEHQLRQHAGVRAADLAAMAGFAPPALHSLGVRLGASMSTRLFNLVITNVPGPQRPMYADGVRLQASYPVIPLTRGHALAIGMTGYNARLHIGVLADRDAVPDLEILDGTLADALAELLEAATSHTGRSH